MVEFDPINTLLMLIYKKGFGKMPYTVIGSSAWGGSSIPEKARYQVKGARNANGGQFWIITQWRSGCQNFKKSCIYVVGQHE